VLFEFLLYHCPAILDDEDLFDRFLFFVHGLLRRAVRTEWERLTARVRSVSPC
jgi:hypothetical protein